jgi:hypothetical protein
MQNRLAEEINQFLKHERVITDDPEQISIIIGTRNKGKANREREEKE